MRVKICSRPTLREIRVVRCIVPHPWNSVTNLPFCAIRIVKSVLSVIIKRHPGLKRRHKVRGGFLIGAKYAESSKSCWVLVRPPDHPVQASRQPAHHLRVRSLVPCFGLVGARIPLLPNARILGVVCAVLVRLSLLAFPVPILVCSSRFRFVMCNAQPSMMGTRLAWVRCRKPIVTAPDEATGSFLRS